MALEAATRDRIQSLIDSEPVVLFMKGEPGAPRCGFSAQVVQILKNYRETMIKAGPPYRYG